MVNITTVTVKSNLLQPGALLDEYRIMKIIGDGGFSVVYQAEDIELDRLVAIKQLNPGTFAESSAEARFLREAKLAASLNHPNIVAIYALKRRAETVFLVMEYLDGGTVRDMLSAYRFLPIDTLVKLASHVCQALDVLHQRGIIHRDIKPENILCATNGNFKLADFGLAHVMHVDLRRSSAGPQSGTLLYMSPEQAAGKELTAQSDIYSLATVLYEALTGSYYLPEITVGGDIDENEIIDRIQAGDPLLPSQIAPRIGTSFDLPLMRALSKDPEERYRSGGEFLSALTVAAQAAPLGPSTQEIRELLYEIRALRDLLEEPEQAQLQLEDLWLRDSNLPEVVAERGETMITLGNPAGYDLLEEAVSREPGLPFAQIKLAEYYRDQGDEEAYGIAMIDAVEADADLIYSLYYQRIVASIKHPDEFWMYLNIFKAARPSLTSTFNVGRIYALIKGYEDEAIEAFTKVIQEDPRNGSAYVALGSVWLSMDEPGRAVPYFERATDADFPAFPPNELYKSVTAYRLSHAYLGLALAAAYSNRLLQSAQAAVALWENDPDELAAHCETLLSIYRSTALRWLEEQRYQDVADLLGMALPLAEACGDNAILLTLGIAQGLIGAIFRKTGAFTEAVEWLRAAIEVLNSLETSDYYEAGRTYLEKAKKELKSIKN